MYTPSITPNTEPRIPPSTPTSSPSSPLPSRLPSPSPADTAASLLMADDKGKIEPGNIFPFQHTLSHSKSSPYEQLSTLQNMNKPQKSPSDTAHAIQKRSQARHQYTHLLRVCFRERVPRAALSRGPRRPGLESIVRVHEMLPCAGAPSVSPWRQGRRRHNGRQLGRRRDQERVWLLVEVLLEVYQGMLLASRCCHPVCCLSRGRSVLGFPKRHQSASAHTLQQTVCCL